MCRRLFLCSSEPMQWGTGFLLLSHTSEQVWGSGVSSVHVCTESCYRTCQDVALSGMELIALPNPDNYHPGSETHTHTHTFQFFDSVLSSPAPTDWLSFSDNHVMEGDMWNRKIYCVANVFSLHFYIPLLYSHMSDLSHNAQDY